MGSESKPRVRVLCVSPAHPPHDPRILKTIHTLGQHYEVRSLLPWIDSSSVTELPFFPYLAVRLFLVHPLILWQVLRQRPQVLHLFMPELLPIGLLSRLWGCRIVYDVQENHRLKFNRKPRNKARLFQWFFALFDRLARRFAYCVFSDDSYLIEYRGLRQPYAVVHNFPEQQESSLPLPQKGRSETSPDLCYLGLITLDRGLDTMIAVMARLQDQFPTLRLHLFGRCMVDQDTLDRLPGYAQIRHNVLFYGQVDHPTAFARMRQCVAGLALLKPEGDYPYSYPSKIFEYMSVGLPLITSNYPLYRSIVEKHACGFCVEPTDIETILQKIIWLIEQPEARNRLSANANHAFGKHFHWQTEANKLLELYQKIDF